MNKYKQISIKSTTVFLLLFAAFVIHSCKKDTSNSQVGNQVTQYGDTKLIADAKAYFNQDVNTKESVAQTNGVNIGNKTLRQFINKTTIWDKAFVQTLSFGKAVVIPVTYAQELYIHRGRYSLPMSSLTWLIIYADDNKKQHAELITKIPDATYLNSTDSIRAYTGYIMVEDFQGNFIKGFNYLADGTIQKLNAPSTSVKIDNKTQVQDFDCTTTDYFSCGPDICTYTDTETICVLMDAGGSSNDGSDPGGYPNVGGGGAGNGNANGGAGTNPSCPPTVNESIDSKHYTVNSTPCNVPPPVKDITTNDIVDPCINSAVQNAIDNSFNTVVTMLANSVFNQNDSFNLHFSDVTTLANNVDGDTNSSYSPTAHTFNAFVQLNRNKLSKSASEYVVITAFHEILHAYMDSNGSGSEFAQHTDMVTKYKNIMANDLNVMYPNMKPEDADALAWGGLGDTQAWKDMIKNDPDQANKIVAINESYKNGTTGTKCTQ